MFDIVPIDSRECKECSHFNICSIKEEKENILKVLRSIDRINEEESDFNVILSCRHFNTGVTTR